LAIHKPPEKTSAQILRDVKPQFNKSDLFAPWFAAEQERHAQDPTWKKKYKRKGGFDIKIGHGGTLDPMATGVLIVGVGRGTKSLSNFLGCTKSYEATLLFGAATDTYDSTGKIVKRAPYAHLTRDTVEKALEQFRGKIMQRPPIFSALRVNGKRMYEYAREGKELPREIVERPVEVIELEVVEWMEGGTHDFKYPEEEADAETKKAAEALIGSGLDRADDGKDGEVKEKSSGQEEHQEKDSHAEGDPTDPTITTLPEDTTDPTIKTPLPEAGDSTSAAAQATPETPEQSAPPAVKLRMTVTSGFYVRSLCHNLAEAVGSLGMMSALVRSRQGDFELGKNVVEYEEFEKGEEVWGPQVRSMLTDWQEKCAAAQADEEG
ncbi:pseudouridine synthase, partial [Eremomyces bilateralis CBS 781.70]